MTETPDYIIWYCRNNKSMGKPIIVKDCNENKISPVSKVELNNVNIKMVFNNSTGQAKRSGATTVLEVYLND